MTKEMYEDLLERNRLQISELNTLTEEQDKHIIELKAYNEKLLDGDIEKHNKIVELKEQVDALANVNIKAQNIIGKAKELLKQFLEAKNGEDTYKAEWEAEQFLKELEK